MTTWRKSSYSGSGTSECVEVARIADAIGLRDSRATEVGHLTLTPRAFTALLTHIKRSEPR
ncbi:DUF397 domain-containing protein [Actinomadura sp. 1N219]|uniref:DUF397 domain-containing protein n=1 Tax=Actinomadura sp. 1N219 TaxID=3375152 RepID=UPI0037938CAD